MSGLGKGQIGSEWNIRPSKKPSFFCENKVNFVKNIRSDAIMPVKTTTFCTGFLEYNSSLFFCKAMYKTNIS